MSENIEPSKQNSSRKNKRYDSTRIANLLVKHNFDLQKVATICEIKGVHKLLNFINKSQSLQNLISLRRDSLLFLAENNLYDLLLAKDPEATYFALKTLGRQNYSEKPIDNVIPTININSLNTLPDNALRTLIEQNKTDIRQNIMLKSARMKQEENEAEEI